MSKPFLTSRTVWVNVITAIVAFVALPEFQQVVGPDAIRYVVVIQAALNVVLRVITTQPVSLSRS